MSTRAFRKILPYLIAAAVLVYTVFFVYRKMHDTLPVLPEEISACVRIVTAKGSGCGFIIEIGQEEMVVATACHVLEGYDGNSYVELYDGVRVFGQQFGADETYDVAFLGIPYEEGFTKKDGDRYGSVDITSYPAIEPDTDCRIPDITGSFTDPLIYEGKILSEGEYFYELDRVLMRGSVSPVSGSYPGEGMSGSPVFSSDGTLLGMLVAGNEDGIIAGVTVSDIARCYGLL